MASAAIIGSPYLFSNGVTKYSSLENINIGVIGTGDRGSGLTSIINSMDNIDVTACCDLLPFRLEQGIKKSYTKTKGYDDYRRLLDDKNVDAVIIATPLSTHASIAIDAIDAGKHVYCEKTLAKGYSNIEQLLNKNKNNSLIFQTGHQYHSSRLYTNIVRLIKEGKVGNITAFECQWNRHGNWRRPVPDPTLERVLNWRMYREYSSGLAAELSSHQIDFVNWVLDATPNKVIGMGGVDYWKDGRETYDNIHLIYNYPNGVKAKFTCLTSNANDGYQIKVFGDKGTIIIDTKNAWFFPEGKKKEATMEIDGVSGATAQWDEDKGIPLNFEHLDPSKQALLDFCDAIKNNTQPKSNIVTGAKAAVCVQMGIDAMDKSKEIVWNFNI